MNLQEKVIVVTGGANGIGRALCRRFAAEGARGIVVADIDLERAASVAREINGIAIKTDVSKESDITRLVEQTIETLGRIDLFCSNAGIFGAMGGAEVANEDWQ